MKAVVISLGGSLIVPEQIDLVFLHKFKKLLKKYYHSHKFVVVCGGGTIARKYMDALSFEHKPEKELAQAGIRATRMNALFLMQFFGKEANQSLPKEMKEVKARLPKNKVIICGALRFLPQSTSDSTAARLAHYLKTEFINMTNVAGLYSADPRTHKDAKFIQKISWKDFEKKAKVLAYKPGQHFVLDQQAAMVIRKHKIRTIILGKDLRELENVINHKSFKGTVIEG